MLSLGLVPHPCDHSPRPRAACAPPPHKAASPLTRPRHSRRPVSLFGYRCAGRCNSNGHDGTPQAMDMHSARNLSHALWNPQGSVQARGAPVTRPAGARPQRSARAKPGLRRAREARAACRAAPRPLTGRAARRGRRNLHRGWEEGQVTRGWPQVRLGAPSRESSRAPGPLLPCCRVKEPRLVAAGLGPHAPSPKMHRAAAPCRHAPPR